MGKRLSYYERAKRLRVELGKLHDDMVAAKDRGEMSGDFFTRLRVAEAHDKLEIAEAELEKWEG